MVLYDDIKKVFYVFEIHKILKVSRYKIQNTFNFPITTKYKLQKYCICISNMYLKYIYFKYCPSLVTRCSLYHENTGCIYTICCEIRCNILLNMKITPMREVVW